MDARLLAVTSSKAEVEDRIANLFDQHYVALCRLASLLLSDAAMAEDVVQEAFLRTFSGWRRLRDPDLAERYIRQSVVNLCRSRYRHRDAEHRGNAQVGLREDRARRQSRWEGDRQDMVVDVLDAVRCLPPRQRISIVLRYYLDLPEAEVAAAMGCSIGTVKSQVAKAKATLAIALREPATAVIGEVGGEVGAVTADDGPAPVDAEPVNEEAVNEEAVIEVAVNEDVEWSA